MDNLIKSGDNFTVLKFKKLIDINGFDDVHDSIAQLSDTKGFFIIEDIGEISLEWDNNASTVCFLDGIHYSIVEIINLINLKAKKQLKN